MLLLGFGGEAVFSLIHVESLTAHKREKEKEVLVVETTMMSC